MQNRCTWLFFFCAALLLRPLYSITQYFHKDECRFCSSGTKKKKGGNLWLCFPSHQAEPFILFSVFSWIMMLALYFLCMATWSLYFHWTVQLHHPLSLLLAAVQVFYCVFLPSPGREKAASSSVIHKNLSGVATLPYFEDPVDVVQAPV